MPFCTSGLGDSVRPRKGSIPNIEKKPLLTASTFVKWLVPSRT